ncbi:hypothetical protein CGT77_10450 [Vibrio cholerae]|nr:hypothetical protein [Vibrio cholerae]EGR0158558.1 hypothetical protein [Vibrio cholerae]EGR0518511.1 hypothetical protein [Vibrio cholerae]EGR2535472.1 hypothetical protein [Vibrio cholerae]EGR3977221.1 hypothetical protein [Vibrio cholerae]
MSKPLETAKASYEAFVLFVCVVRESIWNIPLLLEAAAVLATFVHPNHIMYLCSWGWNSLAAYLQLQVVWV